MVMHRSCHLPNQACFLISFSWQHKPPVCPKMSAVSTYCAQHCRLLEISVLQQSLTHYDKRERIMSFAAHELPTFTLKGSTCKTYSISLILGREPSKIHPWATG